jgi:hypothetical protein
VDVVGLDGDGAVGFEGQQGLYPNHASRIGVDGPRHPACWLGGGDEGHRQRGIRGVVAPVQVGAQTWETGAVGVHLLVCELSVKYS